MKQFLALCFDTETSGLPKDQNKPGQLFPEEWPHMLSYAYQIRLYTEYPNGTLVPGISLKTVAVIVNNGKIELDVQATSVNKLTDEILATQGYQLDDCIPSIIKDFERVDVIIAHNAKFDFHVFIAALKRINAKVLTDHFINMLQCKTVCAAENTRDIVGILKPDGYDDAARNDNPAEPYKRPKLTELFKFLFGVDVYQSHDAIDDVLLLDRCVSELFRKGYWQRNVVDKFIL